MNIFGHTQVTNQPLSNPIACYSEHIQILLKFLWDFFSLLISCLTDPPPTASHTLIYTHVLISV